MYGCRYYQKKGWQCQRCWHPAKIQANLGVVQMGTHYYCAECKDSVPGEFEVPAQLIINISDSDRKSGMM